MSLIQIKIDPLSLECPICFDLLKTPTMPTCQHALCKICIESLPKNQCPTCDKPFTIQELAFSRLHQDLVEKVTEAAKAPLSIPVEQLPSPLDIKPHVVNKAFNAPTRAAFLQYGIVKTEDEIESLERMIAAKSISSESDVELFQDFLTEAVKAHGINRSVIPIEAKQYLAKVLLALSELHDPKQVEDVLRSLCLSLRFGQSNVLVITRMEIYFACKNQLANENRDRTKLLHCMIDTIDHPEMPLMVQTEILTLISAYAPDQKEELIFFAYMLKKQQLPPEIVESLTDQLIQSYPLIDKKKYVHLFILGAFEERSKWPLPDHILNQIVSFLLDQIQNPDEEVYLRLGAATTLSQFYIMKHFDRSSRVNPGSLRKGYELLSRNILNPDHAQSSFYYSHVLFRHLNFMPRTSFFAIFRDLLFRIINDHTLPLETHISVFNAVDHVYPIQSNDSIQQAYFIYLIQFMLRKLNEPQYPLELKQMHVKTLIKWFTKNFLTREFHKEFPQVSTLEAIVNLPPIMNNPELLKVALEKQK